MRAFRPEGNAMHEVMTEEAKPKSPNSSISLRRPVKDRLDAFARLGRRTRTATIQLLMDDYCTRHPTFAALVEQELRES